MELWGKLLEFNCSLGKPYATWYLHPADKTILRTCGIWSGLLIGKMTKVDKAKPWCNTISMFIFIVTTITHKDVYLFAVNISRDRIFDCRGGDEWYQKLNSFGMHIS